jgi:hypothetical protein
MIMKFVFEKEKEKVESFKKMTLLMISLAMVIGWHAPSHAVTVFPMPPTPPMGSYLGLYLNDGSNAVYVFDQDLLGQSGIADKNALPGVVTFDGSLGAWNVNVTTGITYPTLGSTSQPEIDLNSVNVSSSGQGERILSIGVCALNFSLNGGSLLEVGGTTAGLVGFDVYFSTSSTFFPNGAAIIGEAGVFGPGAFSGTSSGYAGPGYPYSLTIVSNIKYEENTIGATSFDANLKVPEPTAMLLLGLGLVGLWGFRKSAKK